MRRVNRQVVTIDYYFRNHMDINCICRNLNFPYISLVDKEFHKKSSFMY